MSLVSLTCPSFLATGRLPPASGPSDDRVSPLPATLLWKSTAISMVT